MKKFNWRKPVIYFLLHTNKRNILLNFSEIKKIERFSCREIRNYQKEKLAAILAHAYTKVPYYNRIFKQAGLVKAGMAAADYFDRIPFLTKEIIGKEGRNLYSTDWPTRDTYENTSGGSTGEPVKFLQDRYYNDWNVATKLYFFNTLFNREIGLPEACLWGSERDTHRNSLGLKATAVNFLYNRLFLNFFNVTDDRLYEFVRMINKIRPVSLWTYVEAVDMLAQFIKDKKINISKPEFIISTAGTLYPEIRLKAEQAFSCPVFNQYGSRETGPVAIECSEKKGLHEFFWMNYVEIINSKVYITSLRNFSMPLIRYDIGDTAVESMHGNCACGRFSLKFEEIKGRESSFFKTVRGKKVHGEYFVHLFYFVGWIKKFQIVQKNYNLIICRIVPCGFRNQADMKRIELSIKLVMGDNCRVEWDFLKQIEPSKSGKYLYSICEYDYTKQGAIMNSGRIKFLLKFTISSVLLYISLRYVDFRALRILFVRINPYYLYLSFLIIYAGIFISSLKWKMVSGLQGIDLPFGRAFSAYYSGMFFNSFFPTTIGGDFVRARLVTCPQRPFDKNIVTIIFERYLGFIALALFLFFGSLSGLLLGYTVRVMVPAIFISVFFLLTIVVFFVFKSKTNVSNIFFKYTFTRPLEKYYNALILYKKFSKITLKAIILSCAFQFLAVFYVLVLTIALDIKVPLNYLIIIVPFVSLFSALPVSINGIGLREASYIFFFNAIGLPVASAVAVSFLGFGILILVNSLGGIMFLLNEKI